MVMKKKFTFFNVGTLTPKKKFWDKINFSHQRPDLGPFRDEFDVFDEIEGRFLGFERELDAIFFIEIDKNFATFL